MLVYDILASMTKLFDEIISKVRELPEDVQDSAAEQLMQYIDEIPTLNDQASVAEGRRAFERGAFIPLDQWRHDMGLSNN
jgi:hypothetical protein